MKILYIISLLLFLVIIPDSYAEIGSEVIDGDLTLDGIYTSLEFFFEEGEFIDGDFILVDLSTWQIDAFPIEAVTFDENGDIIFTSSLDEYYNLFGKIVSLDNGTMIADVKFFTPDGSYYQLTYLMY